VPLSKKHETTNLLTGSQQHHNVEKCIWNRKCQFLKNILLAKKHFFRNTKCELATSWKRSRHIRRAHHRSPLSLWGSPSHCEPFSYQLLPFFLRNMSCKQTVLLLSLSLWPFFFHAFFHQHSFPKSTVCVSNVIYQHFITLLHLSK